MGTDDKDALTDEAAAAIARAAAGSRSRLAADATLIQALVRIDEIEVASRAIEEQRADLLEYAIDLTEAVADAVRARDGEPAADAPSAETAATEVPANPGEESGS